MEGCYGEFTRNGVMVNSNVGRGVVVNSHIKCLWRDHMETVLQ